MKTTKSTGELIGTAMTDISRGEHLSRDKETGLIRRAIASDEVPKDMSIKPLNNRQ